MTIHTLPLTEIIPYENNPRKNDKAVDLVAKSIREFGFKVPIVVDANNVIVAGHTRYKAAKRLGIDSVPCVIADDLTEQQVRAFRLVDNKTGEIAQWDVDLLGEELASIDELDMSDLGFGDFLDFAENGPEALELDEPTGEDKHQTCHCPKCGFEFSL